MLIANRSGMMRRNGLPPRCVRVGYVRSNGSQYVQTIVPPASGRISFSLMAEDTDTTVYWKYLGVVVSTTDRIMAYMDSASNPVRYIVDLGTGTGYHGAIKQNLPAITVDAREFRLSRAPAARRFTLFGAAYESVTSQPDGVAMATLATMRLYSASMLDGSGVSLFNLIPVRRGSVGYLYDAVTKTLLGSATSSPLIPGPDITP